MSLFAIAPALPLHAAGKYVAGAYIVFVVVILIYVTIMAIRLGRTEQSAAAQRSGEGGLVGAHAQETWPETFDSASANDCTLADSARRCVLVGAAPPRRANIMNRP